MSSEPPAEGKQTSTEYLFYRRHGTGSIGTDLSFVRYIDKQRKQLRARVPV
jgi:hypothetical protein